jgi:hypothetical protein
VNPYDILGALSGRREYIAATSFFLFSPFHCHAVSIFRTDNNKQSKDIIFGKAMGETRPNSKRTIPKIQRERLRSALGITNLNAWFGPKIPFHLLIRFLYLSSSYNWLFLMNRLRRPRKSLQELSHIRKWTPHTQTGLNTDTLTAVNRLPIQTLLRMSRRMFLSILNLTFRSMSTTKDCPWP